MHPSTQQADALDLALQVRERQQSLTLLYRRADARDRALAGRQAVLAQYGWTGDPDAVQAVLPLASYRLSAGFGLTGPLWEADDGARTSAPSPATRSSRSRPAWSPRSLTPDPTGCARS